MGCGLIMGMVGNSVFKKKKKISFYVAPNTVKYFSDYFPECKQTLEKQTFSCKSFAFANILRWRMFYVETNGALLKKLESLYKIYQSNKKNYITPYFYLNHLN
jgi:hypothetical protein